MIYEGGQGYTDEKGSRKGNEEEEGDGRIRRGWPRSSALSALTALGNGRDGRGRIMIPPPVSPRNVRLPSQEACHAPPPTQSQALLRHAPKWPGPVPDWLLARPASALSPMSDPRFARLKTDPRFRPINKAKNRVVVDDRFKHFFDHNRKKKNNKAKGMPTPPNPFHIPFPLTLGDDQRVSTSMAARLQMITNSTTSADSTAWRMRTKHS